MHDTLSLLPPSSSQSKADPGNGVGLPCLDLEALGRRIRIYRKNCGLNQTELGVLLGYKADFTAQGMTGRLEKGLYEPKLTQALKLCDLFGITLDDLLNGTPKLAEQVEERERSTRVRSGISRQREWQLKNPEKAAVQQYAHLHRDHLTIIYECPHEGPKEDHHFDYRRPFEVLSLCPACHAAESARLRRLTEEALEEK